MDVNGQAFHISNLLIATDGSAHAAAAVEYGAWLAALTGARLNVLHVIDARTLVGNLVSHLSEVMGGGLSSSLVSHVSEYHRSRGQQLLEHAAAICDRYNVECRTELREGNIVKIIVEASQKSDLLMMGQHGEDEERETGFLGSVAERVVRSINKPVILAQSPYREFRRALLAYDGSPAARRTMHALARLALVLKLEIEAVQLVEQDEPTFALVQVHRALKGFPVQVNSHYLIGNSLSIIPEHAREAACDLLAMGAYADLTTKRLSLGSTTEYLMRNSTVPVLVHH
jgi:nucleotide-binding universal stress UspA family protein